MRQKHVETEALGAAVLAVSFEPRDRLFQLSHVVRLPFPLLCDQERDTYRAYGLERGNLRQIFSPRAYGLERGNLRQIFSPRAALTNVKLMARGRMYHFRRSDLRQLGGDFIVDPDGVIRYQYRSAAPHDRPSVEELIERIKAP